MSEKIKFYCNCGKKLNAPATSAGKKAKCTGCGTTLIVPHPGTQKPGIGIRASAPPPPRAPAPAANDFELGLADLDLEEIKPDPPPKSKATPPKPASGPASDSPTLKPAPAPPPGKLIWAEEDDHPFAAVAGASCPKCGAAMHLSARACVACGYNRDTGIQTVAAPKRRTWAGIDWLKRAWARGSDKGSVYWIVVPLVFGIAGMMLGINERKLAAASSAEPETISLKQLLARGPEGNPNLILTDFELCDNYVVETRSVVGVSVGNWSKIWIPIVPRQADAAGGVAAEGSGLSSILSGADAQNVRALIMSTNVSDENEILPKLAVPTMRGMVTNRIAALKGKEKSILHEKYPTTNFDNVIIFQEGREPTSTSTIQLYFIGGALGILIALGLTAKRFLMD